MLTTTLLIVLLPGVTTPTNLLFRLVGLQRRARLILLDVDFSQVSISLFSKLKWIPVFYLIKYRTIFLLFNFLLNLRAPKCVKNRFQLLSVSRGPLGHLTRASLYDLKVPYPHSNSGKRTLAYSASKHFNDLNSHLREYFTASSPRTSKSSPPLSVN